MEKILEQKRNTLSRRRPRNWSPCKVVAVIRQRFRHKLPINSTAVEKQDKGLYTAARKQFGRKGYKKALRLAGFDPKELNPRRISEKWIIREILKLRCRGIPLNFFWIRNHRKKLFAAACKRFGSWCKAIQAAGLSYAKVRKQKHRWWTANRVIARIKQLEGMGVQLSSVATKRSYGDLFSTACVIFDSWSQAVYTAGIDYEQHCLIWSSKAWVRHLTAEDIKNINKQAHEMTRKRKEN